MKKVKRVFLIVLDSFGVGYLPDADLFGDTGANTLKSIAASPAFDTPNMEKIGIFNIDGVDCRPDTSHPIGSFGRLAEASMGKDTTTGHWEIAGIVSPNPMPVYPDGFPEEVLQPFREQTGRGVLCNKPYSGVQVIRDYGEEHLKTGDLIVYTSADSVFQIAAHEEKVPLEELYEDCRIARKILQGKHGVGRVIARPFIGSSAADFSRTRHRHDFSLIPPKRTMLVSLTENGFDTYGVGKIYDIFAGQAVAHTVSMENNEDGMNKTLAWMDEDFNGLCFVNLVDFDMTYGHRRDIDGYANAATVFDRQLGELMARMKDDDVVMITADHGCDPGFTGTDHTREYIPLLIYGKSIKSGVSIGTRSTFADIAATILDMFGIGEQLDGISFWPDIRLEEESPAGEEPVLAASVLEDSSPAVPGRLREFSGEETGTLRKEGAVQSLLKPIVDAVHALREGVQSGGIMADGGAAVSAAAVPDTRMAETPESGSRTALPEEDLLLIREAAEARKQAYAPYSGFSVGAALMDKEGRIYRGCNIENAAYTPTNCAERTAFFRAIADGVRDFARIAVIGGFPDREDYCFPCGVCRQVMMEFCDPDTFEIILAKSEEEYQVVLLKDLLPMGFGPGSMKK